MNVCMRNSVFAGLLSLISSTVSASPIDFTGWTPIGGNWSVAPDGQTVEQLSNGSATFFLSTDDYINTRFEGSLGVNTTSDDDFIGFVFGYNSSTDFLLFDWKQYTQASAEDGFRLAQINGDVSTFWGLSGTGVNILATDYGSTGNDRGWQDNVTYDFTLDFTESRIVIGIEGETIFDVAGNFDSGKFGFYNFSQAGTGYGNLTATDIGGNVPTPAPLTLLGLGLLGLWWQKRRA